MDKYAYMSPFVTVVFLTFLCYYSPFTVIKSIRIKVKTVVTVYI